MKSRRTTLRTSGGWEPFSYNGPFAGIQSYLILDERVNICKFDHGRWNTGAVDLGISCINSALVRFRMSLHLATVYVNLAQPTLHGFTHNGGKHPNTNITTSLAYATTFSPLQTSIHRISFIIIQPDKWRHSDARYAHSSGQVATLTMLITSWREVSVNYPFTSQWLSLNGCRGRACGLWTQKVEAN